MHSLLLWINTLAQRARRVVNHEVSLIIAAFLLMAVVGGGTIGYIVIESYSFFDAFYMTVITLATVGYGEVVPLSSEGRIFTIILIITGLGVFAYAVTIFSSQMVEGRLKNLLNQQFYKFNSKKMENHVIVVGYGRNGQQAVKDLKAYHYQFVVVDSNKDLLKSTEDNIAFVTGDATDDDVLTRAGIQKAMALLSCLPVDADNLFVVLTARSLNPDLTIISRASNVSSEKKLRIAGVNSVVLPEQIGGAHMVKLVARRDIVEFLDRLSLHGESPASLEEVDCMKLPVQLHGKSIQALDIRNRCGVNIIGLKKPDGTFLINPTPDITISPGVKLFVLGTKPQLEKTRRLVGEIS